MATDDSRYGSTRSARPSPTNAWTTTIRRTGPGYPVGQRSDQYEPVLETHEDSENTYTFTNIDKRLNLGISDDGQPGKAALQLTADSTSARQHWTLRRSNLKIDKEALRGSSDKDWENETIFAVNKEPGHTTYVPFPSVESLKSSPDYRKACFARTRRVTSC